ncbi:MAG TPA: ribonuclease P Rpr2/Rpp21/SNM1 subunit [Candidatus Thalassarchaeaceae archaeon]|nr:ribonuclease P Rpr2/Rpp21/SNM1 subunit [Candidatus Thalassarchaeaceae archaeon]
MVGRARRSTRRNSERKLVAERAITHLSSVLESSLGEDDQIADNAARQILSLGKKHGIRPNPRVKRKICRTCKQSMFPGLTSRVRISSKMLVTTCLRCGRKNRQGPDFGGSHDD